MKTFLRLPDGTRFELLAPERIPLNLAIRLQKETGIGPVQLQVRLARTAAAMVRLQPIAEKIQAAGVDERLDLVEEFNAAAVEADLDVLAVGAQIWLSRLAAGENLSFEDACAFPLHEAVREDVAEPGDEDQGEQAGEDAAA